MVRQIVIAALLGLGLSACGVGADEDCATLGLGLQQNAVATSQDPVPPPQHNPTPSVVAADTIAITSMIVVGSPAPASPGDTNSSSQDPIPPKVQGPKVMLIQVQ